MMVIVAMIVKRLFLCCNFIAFELIQIFFVSLHCAYMHMCFVFSCISLHACCIIVTQWGGPGGIEA